MAKRKKGKLESVAKLLKGVYPAPDQLEAAKAFAWWSRSVPPRILEHARPVRLSRGVLIVHVSSSVWANELHYLGDDLLARLREAAPTSRIEISVFRSVLCPTSRSVASLHRARQSRCVWPLCQRSWGAP